MKIPALVPLQSASPCADGDKDSTNDKPIPIPLDKIDKYFSQTSNLASSALNARVLACSDEYFAAASNLLIPTSPIHKPGVFVHTGAWYDGWETRRHNPEPYDWVVIRLGVTSGVVCGVEIDTAYFVGNYGEKVLVEGAYVPAPEATGDTDHGITKPEYTGWTTILPIQPCGPSRRQAWALASESSPVTHIRLRMYPDGGFARLRLYGCVIPPPPAPVTTNSSDPSILPIEELSCALLGGLALSASNQHYTPCSNLLLPGRGKNMGDGWETARSRSPGHVDWAIIKLGLPGSVTKVVVDTKDFRGNFPRAIRVHGLRLPQAGEEGSGRGIAEDPAHDHRDWEELVDGDRLCKADTEHVFEGDDLVAGCDKGRSFSHVKLTLVPDGGVKRFRIFGRRALGA